MACTGRRVLALFLVWTLLKIASCLATKEFLLAADGKAHRLVQVDLSTKWVRQLDFSLVLNPVAIDYDPESERIYWSEVLWQSIYSAYLNGTGKRTLAPRSYGIQADGIAIDHVTKTLYYTHLEDGNVGSIPLSGGRNRTIISGVFTKPRDIELDTQNGHMYISDWESPAKIVRADLSGSRVTTLITGNMGWPNGLAFDIQGSKIYWCDGKLDRVEKANLDGSSRTIIYSEPDSHFYGIDLSMNRLFLSDWGHKKLRRINTDGSGLEFVSPAVFERAMDIKLIRIAETSDAACHALTTPTHARVVTCPSQVKVGTRCTYTCEQGYEISDGDATRTCQSTKTWSGKLIVCSALTCPPFAEPAHARAVTCPIPTRVASTCTYACESGYDRTEGDATRTCGLTKRWSGKDLICSAIACEPLTTPSHAKVVYCPAKATVGTTCTYTCQEGFGILKGNATRVCGNNKIWRGQPLVCSAATCRTLTTPAHARVLSCPSLASVGSRCMYDCEQGYDISDGDATRTCQSTKTWSGKPLVCSSVSTCIPIAEPAHASPVNCSIPAKVGTNCTYACDSGYEHFEGDVTRMCDVNMSWSGKDLICSAIQCHPVATPPHAKVIYCPTEATVGTHCTHACQEGFEILQGNSTRVCENNKIWSGHPMVCSAVTGSSAFTGNRAGVPIYVLALTVSVGVLLVLLIVGAVLFFRKRQTRTENVYDSPMPSMKKMLDKEYSTLYDNVYDTINT